MNPQDVPCHYCAATPGQPCCTKRGVNSGTWHAARLRLHAIRDRQARDAQIEASTRATIAQELRKSAHVMASYDHAGAAALGHFADRLDQDQP